MEAAAAKAAEEATEEEEAAMAEAVKRVQIDAAERRAALKREFEVRVRSRYCVEGARYAMGEAVCE
jgi:hypothetical protein